MKKQARARSWVDGVNLFLGLLLFVAPWFTNLPLAADWSAWMIGGVVAFNASFALVGFAAWEEWTNAVLGLWAASLPWLCGFEAHAGATWTYAILGLSIASFAGLQLWFAYRGPLGPSPHPAGKPV